MTKIYACGAAELAAGEVRRIEVPGRGPIALYHIEDGYYATDDTCTHGEASLSEGLIEDGLIVCPFHLGSFCIRTGAPAAPPCFTPLEVYAVSIEDGVVFIQLPESEATASEG